MDLEYLSEDIKSQIEKFRQQYGVGKAFVSIFPDGIVVPWKPLPLSEYIRYSELSNQNKLSVFLEDEIFLSCVLDNTIRKQLNYLKAGTVQTVVQHIWQLSCPSDADELNLILNHKRQQVWNAHNAILHEFVKWITLAFPYKPEEVYAMSFDQLSRTLVLAEQKLMLMGLLDKPFEALLQGEEERIQQPLEKPDPKKIWEEIHGIQPPDIKRRQRFEEADEFDEVQRASNVKQFSKIATDMPVLPPHPFKEGERERFLARARGETPRKSWKQALNELRVQEHKSKSKEMYEPVLLPPEQLPSEIMEDPNVSPIIKYGGRKDGKLQQGIRIDPSNPHDNSWVRQPIKVDLALEELSQLKNLSGHELWDLDIERAKMVEDAQKHYAPVLKYLAERRAVVAEKSKQKEKK